MDEVLFHLSQRLESLQVITYSAIQHGRILFDSYSAQGYELVLSVYNSPQLAQIQDSAYYKLQELLTYIREFSTFVISHTHPTVVYARISNIIGPDLNRDNLYAGCIGFAIGGGVGVVIGLCLQSPPRPLSYMRAIAATSFTGVDTVAVLEDVTTPTISASDDVLIQVRAASIDPVDIKICGGYARVLRFQLNKYNPNVKGELPVVLGRDCAGIVVEIGNGVTRVDVGDEVWAVVPPWAPGMLSDLVVVKDCWVSRKPRCLGFEGSASIPYSGSVAWDAVVNRANIGPATAKGKKILVHCGSTGVGVIITQLCHSWNAAVTVTCLNRASPVMKALGASEVIPLETADIENQLSKERFNVVFNNAGPVAHQFCLRLCTPEGFVVTPVCSSLASDTYGIILGSLYSGWVRIIHAIFGSTSWGTVPLNASILDELSKLVDSGVLQPVVDKILIPHDFDKAFQHIDSAHAIGKTVIQFSSSRILLPHGQPDVVT
ncbi:NAD(P)H oxidoreductase RTN4IP1, mitochondrial-like [Lycorma delicatula]|uniref:NAD(P)H oxidoreductase RTN4IP1, mitochondrial-like n=1 Tax=Lycorma delicatula TaxID=130591 RepID=UPI003F510C5D